MVSCICNTFLYACELNGCVFISLRVREFERESEEGRELAAVAREMSETVTDPQIKATQVSGWGRLLTLSSLFDLSSILGSWLMIIGLYHSSSMYCSAHACTVV